MVGRISSSIRKANSPANIGMKSEIVDVIIAGKCFDATANPIVGIAVDNIPSPKKGNMALLSMCLNSNDIDVEKTINVKVIVPSANVSMDIPIVSGAVLFLLRLLYVYE